MRQVAWEIQNQEQTQEVRLPDGLPDIGRVLTAWGQVILRSKEWRGNGMSASGGVMARVMYAPEDDSEPRCIDTWIPFQSKWDFPETEREGTIRVVPLLRGIDARTISARKMMVRASIGVLGEALVPWETEIFAPAKLPEGVELLRWKRAKKRFFWMRNCPYLPPARQRIKSYILKCSPNCRIRRSWPAG